MREDYFNLKETARAIGISDSSMLKLIKKVPSFPALHVGGSWVIPKKSFFKWFEKDENCYLLDDLFNCRVYIDYERIRENGRLYTQHLIHRGTLQKILRNEEKNRRYKTHLEF